MAAGKQHYGSKWFSGCGENRDVTQWHLVKRETGELLPSSSFSRRRESIFSAASRHRPSPSTGPRAGSSRGWRALTKCHWGHY